MKEESGSEELPAETLSLTTGGYGVTDVAAQLLRQAAAAVDFDKGDAGGIKKRSG